MIKKYSKEKRIQTHIQADRDEWIEYLGEQPSLFDQEQIGIDNLTWHKIIQGKRPLVSIAQWRLARFRRHFHLGDVLGHEWREFVLNRDSVTIPGFKYPMSAADLRSAYAEKQKALTNERLLNDATSLLEMYRCLFGASVKNYPANTVSFAGLDNSTVKRGDGNIQFVS